MLTTLQSQLAPFIEECRQHLSTAPSKPTTQTAPEVSAHVKAILAEAGRAIQQWEASPEGQAKLQALKGMSLAEVRQELIALLQSPVFAPTLELISTPSLPILKYPIQSISLALKLEVDFIFGFSGSIGVAADPAQLIQFLKDPHNGSLSTATFVSGWLNEGVDASAMTGIEVGISGCTPDDLGGFSSGVEATFDILSDIFENPELPGITAQYYHGSSDESWGATVGLVWGAGAGAVTTQSYTLVLTNSDLSLPPIYQPDAEHMLIITQITCIKDNVNPADPFPDGVYFYFTPDGGTQYRYPTWDHRDMTQDDSSTLSNNNTWYPGRSVKFNNSVTVALWSEYPDGDTDSLGDEVIFYYSGFATWNPGWLPVSRPGSIENGWNDIEYQVHAQLIY